MLNFIFQLRKLFYDFLAIVLFVRRICLKHRAMDIVNCGCLNELYIFIVSQIWVKLSHLLEQELNMIVLPR